MAVYKHFREGDSGRFCRRACRPKARCQPRILLAGHAETKGGMINDRC